VVSLLRGVRFLTRLASDATHAAHDEFIGRHVWVHGDRAHIEARGTHHIDAPAEYLEALEHDVSALDGVRWAAVNGVLGDLVVDFDPGRVAADDIRRVVGRVEREYAMEGRSRDRMRHPSEFEPVFDELVEIAGDLLGAATGLAGRLVPGLALPAEAASLVPSLELLPRVRRLLEARFGRTRVELAVSLTGSVLGAAAQSPLGSLADAALRTVELPAALARRTVWERRAHDLAREPDQARAAAQVPPEHRPVPLPDGPVERYIAKAGMATALTAAAILPFGGVPKAARAVAAGAPKAARVGVDAYAAEVSRLLSRRGAVIRDPKPLRYLDRFDTVIIDAAVLHGGQDGALDSLTDEVISAAHAVGKVVITPSDADQVNQVGADAVIAGGSHLAESVRELQADGHTVLLIADHNDAGLTAADLGVGILAAGRRPPWSANILCGPDLADVWLLLQACVLARTVSDRGIRLALLGSVGGALLGLVGPEQGAGRRGAMPVSAAGLTAVLASVWAAHRLAGQRLPQPPDTRKWHAMPVEQALEELRSDPGGLSEAAAARRRAVEAGDDGPPEENLVTATVSELDTPLTTPLAAGAAVSAATGAAIDAGLVASVMVGNALLGAAQRLTATRAVRRLATVGALQARLRRPGGEQVADASQLVPGEIITLQAGDAVPADCRIIEASRLEVDESSLTGESLPVAKDPRPTDAEAVADRSSMLYAGTTVAAGRALAVVTAVGAATEADRSASSVADADTPSGVETRLHELASASLPVAVSAAAAILGLGLLRGQVGQSVTSAVALAVAAVPEGLPSVATVAQLSAARRLSHRNVLVRTPRTLEALGRVTTVCFDKTGTLTEGRVDVRRVVTGDTEEAVDALTGDRRKVLATALRACPPEEDGPDLPHATDRAVLAGGRAAGVSRDEDEPGWHHVRELPFEPGRGYHAVLGQTDGRQVISVKGAPEVVLPRCVAMRAGDSVSPLTPADHHALEQQVRALALRGFRVLAVAERAASDRQSLDASRVERLEFAGLLCLADPVRPTAAAAVETLRRAGVRAIMLTGDHPSTAEAIAAELDLPVDKIITGTQVESLSEEDLADLARDAAVFARVSPSHKVAIVRALRRTGQAVAVTGDGANDAPAIRLADVGIALGPDSTPAAKQAADIVITDERIETIVDAVIESRAMWRSVRDSVGLLLGGNLGEIGFTVGSSLLSARSALNARQLLAINLLTDLLPALAVAARPPRGISPETLLAEGPEAAVGTALSRDIAARAIATGVCATAAWLLGRFVSPVGGAGTVAFATLVGAQLAQTAASAYSDPVVLTTAVVSAAITVALVQAPPTSIFFGCRPLAPHEWAIAAATSMAAIPIAAYAGRLVAGRQAAAAAQKEQPSPSEPEVVTG
jgi:cation-transporting P-type ATPase I